MTQNAYAPAFTIDGEIIIPRRDWDFLTALQALQDQGLSQSRIAKIALAQHGVELTSRGVWRLLERRRLGEVVADDGVGECVSVVTRIPGKDAPE